MIKIRKIRSNKTLNQKVYKQVGKKKKGCGENEFLPACSPCRRRGWEGSVSAILCQQNIKTEKFSFPLSR
jgi:hypothetical protein